MDFVVIVVVESCDGECFLFGVNVNWGGWMYFCFVGFIEVGELLEVIVYCEIEEELGVCFFVLCYIFL